MRYFLDSSVIVAAGLAIDPRKLSVFRDQAERDHIGLITSEVVIDEVVHKFREKVELERRQVESAIQKMTKTVSQGFLVRISDDQVNRWCEQYEEFVRSIFENEHPGSGVQGYPTISHEAVAEKARLGKRPYQKGDKDGYRDSLIWRSVVEAVIADPGSTVCLVTGNHSDFCQAVDGGNYLHPDLVHELLMEGLDPVSVQILDSIDHIADRNWNYQIEIASMLDQELKINVAKASQYRDDFENAIIDFFEITEIPQGQPDNVENIFVEDSQVINAEIIDFLEAHAEISEKASGIILIAKVSAVCEIEILGYAERTYVDESGEVVQAGEEVMSGTTTTPIEIEISIVYDLGWNVVSTAASLSGSNEWVHIKLFE